WLIWRRNDRSSRHEFPKLPVLQRRQTASKDKCPGKVQIRARHIGHRSSAVILAETGPLEPTTRQHCHWSGFFVVTLRVSMASCWDRNTRPDRCARKSERF